MVILTLSDCTISGNEASGNGGGIFNNYDVGSGYYGTISSISNCTISGNSAGEGGGIYNSYFINSNFQPAPSAENTSEDKGGGIYNGNGATLEMTNSTVSGNVKQLWRRNF